MKRTFDSTGPDTPAGPESRILDAAEAVFAERGFAGASMREIVSRAGVNVATVYYHFDSKDGLMDAALRRRFQPIEQEHIRLLEALEREAGGKPVPVDRLLDALLAPVLRLASSETRESRVAMRLIGRIVNEPDPGTQRLLQRRHERIREAYLAAFRRSVPHLDEAGLQWRLEFFWGALAFVLCNQTKLLAITRGLCDPSDTATLRTQMLASFTAGFSAPAGGGAAAAGSRHSRRRSS